jgi:hypothetical protein
MDTFACLLPTIDDAVADFKGNVVASNAPPSKAMLKAVAKIPVLDAQGKEMFFEDLYNPLGLTGKKRTLVIFIRHFFCGVSVPTVVCCPPAQKARLS